MELEVALDGVLKVDEEGFVCMSGRDYLKMVRPHHQEKGLSCLGKIINTMGERSAISQKLKQIITNTIKFYGTDQRIYIKVSGTKALGFIKVGEKKLFYHDYIGSIKELMPTAVLDIYVHESCQRTGIGKEIFQKFLKTEGKNPEKLAYDRPSQKLISFLKKHYNLCSYIPQNNNYVIFDRFFGKGSKHQKQQNSSKMGNSKTKISQTYYKQRSNPIVLEKMNLNSTMKNQPMDSLNRLTEQMQGMNLKKREGLGQSYKDIKEIKDQSKSSFGCPWAVDQKLGFRTTSNAYGNYYKQRR